MEFEVLEIETTGSPERPASYELTDNLKMVSIKDTLQVIYLMPGYEDRPILEENNNGRVASIEERTLGADFPNPTTGLYFEDGRYRLSEVSEVVDSINKLEQGNADELDVVLEIGDVWLQAQKLTSTKADPKIAKLKDDIETQVKYCSNRFIKISELFGHLSFEEFEPILARLATQKYYIRSTIKRKDSKFEKEAVSNLLYNHILPAQVSSA